MLTLPDAEVRALATGEIVIAFVARMTVAEGDELTLEPAGPMPADDLKPAYRRWAAVPAPDGPWTAVVLAIHSAALLDPDAGTSRHIRTEPGTDDLAILRVYGPDGPVLSDTAFGARVRSIEGAMTG
ncbi:MAG: hypothetical protein M3349_06385 [Actinomycetota bacterium]|nr:hypothetical protein [Actinomycetota bacterium]